jgi:hypothetical protein
LSFCYCVLKKRRKVSKSQLWDKQTSLAEFSTFGLVPIWNSTNFSTRISVIAILCLTLLIFYVPQGKEYFQSQSLHSISFSEGASRKPIPRYSVWNNASPTFGIQLADNSITVGKSMIMQVSFSVAGRLTIHQGSSNPQFFRL